MASSRIGELDFLKAVFIVLMVAFHLVYIGDTYPYAKQVVYTFHMAGFLFISGYVTNVLKTTSTYVKGLFWVLLPYLILELGYIVMASILPIREHINDLSVGVMLKHLFLSPIGPYWYLHTLILCSLCYFLVHRILPVRVKCPRWLLLGILLWGLSLCKLISFDNAVYFVAGTAIRSHQLHFKSFFIPSIWMVFPVVLLCCFEANLDRGTLGGVAITYFVISWLLSTYAYLPDSLLRITDFIGRNTLVVLLFSPVFTFVSKYYQDLLLFEPSGMLFMVVSVLFAISGSFAIAWMSDTLRVSRFVFGRSNVLMK